ncbi:MAG: cell division protein FtsA [Chloroflexi bacterium]|nr:cell division protein FtsA [Chloroflexota bacterium]MCL5075643.1 cell division protein FtsA [Chloroflexota bacterium]
MSKGKTIVGIDAGTTKVSTLIGEVGADGSIHVIGVGICPSRGLRKGVVVNIDETVESIGMSVEKAERVSGYKIVSAYVGIAGGHIASLNNRGVVAVSHPDRSITQEDVQRAIEAARVINVPSNREIIHTIPRHFIVDGQEGVKNPIGMIGYRLDVETHIVTGAVTAIQNLTKCVHKLGIDIDEIVLEPLASSEAVLTDEEREMGVVMADIGGGTTELAIFIDGSAWHTAIIPVGGNHISNDIAVGLRTPLAMADDLKIKWGHALSTNINENDRIEITTFGRAQKEEVPRSALCEVIEARLQEIFALIEAEIKRSGYDGLLPAGLVLTGGTSELPGIAELARDMLQLPVRIGTPSGIHGLIDSLTSAAYSTSVGLLLWGARFGDEPSAVRSFGHSRGTAIKQMSRIKEGVSVYGRVKNWFKAFLP